MRCPRVSRLCQVAAFLLLVLWVPVTQHCGLEAAGLLTAEACGDCASTASCAQDDCGVVEEGLFAGTMTLIKLVVPLFVAGMCLLWAVRAVAILEVPAWIRVERPRAWLVQWQFVRRAALAPRAPSLVFA